MDRILFERVLVLLGNHMVDRGYLLRLRTALDLRLMMTIWILAFQDTFRSVAVTFGVPSRHTVHYHYKVIIKCLREIAPLFIQSPDRFERDNIKAYFERKYGYPGAVGCVDGSHIYISAPLIQAQRYVNRFKKYSILLQAVCDHKGVFRDIFVGQPGSMNDSRMFQRSPLSQNLLHNPNMLSPGEHILGDGAYILTDKLMTPYRDNGRLTRRKRRHNFRHASARSAIERAFAYDKGLWRRQKFMLVYSQLYLVDSVVASCVLTNFTKLNGHPYLDPAGNFMALEPQLRGEQPPADCHAVDAVVIPDHEDPDDPDEFVHGGHVENEFGPDNLDAFIPDKDPVLRRARQEGQLKRDFIAYTIQ